MKNKVILGVISIFLFSCAANDAGGSTEQHDNDGKGKYGIYKDCKWFLDATCNEADLCGFAEAKKANPSLARKAAIARARAELAAQISTRVKALLRDHMEESGVYGNAQASEYTESVIKQVTDQVLEYSSVDDSCVLSDDTVVVRVAWNKEIAKEATAAAVKREEALYSKFLGEQAFKRLEEETKNSDRWDEELNED